MNISTITSPASAHIDDKRGDLNQQTGNANLHPPIINIVRLSRLYLRHFLAFDPPELRCLVASEFSVEGEFYLRLYWKMKNGFRVKIEQYATVYGCERSVVVKIPADLDEIELVFFNIWKKKKQKLYLPKH